METRFALLRHTGYGPDHYDLMLQRGQVLWTWQFSVNPAAPGTVGPLPCRRIADHRLAYLDHEGSVTRGRGEVKRLTGGQCSLVHQGPVLHLEISAGPMQASWRLVRGEGEGENWELRKESPSASQPRS